MESHIFLNKCKALVADYTNNKLNEEGTKDIKMERGTYVRTEEGVHVHQEEVYVVWSVKVLQNNKAMLGTPLLDGMYYEVTYNGDEDEYYFDAYKKEFNESIRYTETEED